MLVPFLTISTDYYSFGRHTMYVTIQSMKIIFCVVFLHFTLFIGLASASTYSGNFMGLSTEVTTKAEFKNFSRSSILRISQVFTYGPEVTVPFRFRAGIGWFPEQPIALAVGVELPLLEKLSPRRTRSFGLYLIADGGISFFNGIGFEARGLVVGMLPVSQLGSIAIGVGLYTKKRMVLSIGYWTGLFPLLVD
jgi:hypothetical protein